MAALSWIPLLFVPASIVVAVTTGRWASLLGIPIVLVSTILASPYNPVHRIAHIVSLASLGYCLIAATVLTPSTWSAFAFALSFLAIRLLNRIAWKWAYSAVLGSEALTAHLFQTANLYIKVKPFGLKSAALNPRQEGRRTAAAREADALGQDHPPDRP